MGKFLTGKGTIPLGNLGFTFIELIVAILILSILIILSLAVLNPVAQIQKAKDATRQNDLNQLYTALDTYYNDKGCYPTALSDLNSGTPIYIKKIPIDPDTSSGVKYNYIVDSDTNSCPQWFNIITRGYKTSSTSPCPLEQLDTCLPINYTTYGYNFCKISGNVVCSVVVTKTLPVLSVTPSPIPTTNPNATPTLVPGGCYCPNAVYDIPPNLGPGNCNNVGNNGHYCNAGCTIACQ